MLKKLFQNYIHSFSGLPKEAWILSFVWFVNRSGSMVIFFLSIYFTEKLGMHVMLAGQLIGAYGLGSLAGTTLGGWLSDRWGTRLVQFWSLLLSGCMYIFLERLEDSLHIAISLFLLALFADAYRPANLSAIARVCNDDNRARGFALNRLAMSLGIAIGPAVGGFLASINYQLLFWVDGATCLLAATLFYFFFRNSSEINPVSADQGKRDSDSPLRDLSLLSMLFIILIIGIVFFQIFGTWPLFLKSVYGLKESHLGFLFTLNCLIIAFAEMPIVHRMQKKNILNVMAWGSLLLIGGFTILPLGYGLFYAIFTVLVWTLGEMLVFPFTATWISNRSNERNRGRYMGMFTFTFSLAFVIGPAAGTFVYDTSGTDVLWYGTGLIGLSVFLCFSKMAKRKS